MRRSGCGCLDAPQAKKPTRWRCCCERPHPRSWPRRSCRCSPRTSTNMLWRSHARAAIRQQSPRTFRRSDCGSSSHTRTEHIAFRPTYAKCACSRLTTCCSDPPFSRLDLITCRNLLIYMGAELQEKVIPIFHYALRSDGYLFLGSSENVTRHSRMFSTIDKTNRIFQKRPGSNLRLPEFPLTAATRDGSLPRAKPVAGGLRGKSAQRSCSTDTLRLTPSSTPLARCCIFRPARESIWSSPRGLRITISFRWRGEGCAWSFVPRSTRR